MTPEQQFRLAGFLSDELGLADRVGDRDPPRDGSEPGDVPADDHARRPVSSPASSRAALFGTRTADEVARTTWAPCGRRPGGRGRRRRRGRTRPRPSRCSSWSSSPASTPPDTARGDRRLHPPDRPDAPHARRRPARTLRPRSGRRLARTGERRRAVEPLLLEAAAWLRANRPANAIDTAPIHGDAGPGNFVHDGERVLILTDWEFAHLGDPAEDWVYIAEEKGAGAMSPGRLAAPHRGAHRLVDPRRRVAVLGRAQPVQGGLRERHGAAHLRARRHAAPRHADRRHRAVPRVPQAADHHRPRLVVVAWGQAPRQHVTCVSDPCVTCWLAFGGSVLAALVDPPTGECISEFLCSGRCAVELNSRSTRNDHDR